MKTSLKRSEIIEKLKSILHDPSSIRIALQSVIELYSSDKYYILLIERKGKFQTVYLHLVYGWIEFEIGNLEELKPAKDHYVDYILSFNPD